MTAEIPCGRWVIPVADDGSTNPESGYTCGEEGDLCSHCEGITRLRAELEKMREGPEWTCAQGHRFRYQDGHGCPTCLASLRAELETMTALRDSEADRVHRVAANHDACEQELVASEEENASLRAELKAVRAYARWLEAGKPETDAEAIANFERFLSEAGPPPAREGIASLRAELEAARAALVTVKPRRKYELSWIDTNAFERWEALRDQGKK